MRVPVLEICEANEYLKGLCKVTFWIFGSSTKVDPKLSSKFWVLTLVIKIVVCRMVFLRKRNRKLSRFTDTWRQPISDNNLFFLISAYLLTFFLSNANKWIKRLSVDSWLSAVKVDWLLNDPVIVSSCVTKDNVCLFLRWAIFWNHPLLNTRRWQS